MKKRERITAVTYEAPYKIQTHADGFSDRVSILDANGAEVMRIKRLAPEQVEAFMFLEDAAEQGTLRAMEVNDY